MTNAASRIETAKAELLNARIAREAMEAGLEADYPTPGNDCDDVTFDRWNDDYEDAREARDGFTIDDRNRDAETELLQAVREAMADMMTGTIADVAFAAALGERHGFSKRGAMLDICIRLNTATL